MSESESEREKSFKFCISIVWGESSDRQRNIIDRCIKRQRKCLEGVGVDEWLDTGSWLSRTSDHIDFPIDGFVIIVRRSDICEDIAIGRIDRQHRSIISSSIMKDGHIVSDRFLRDSLGIIIESRLDRESSLIEYIIGDSEILESRILLEKIFYPEDKMCSLDIDEGWFEIASCETIDECTLELILGNIVIFIHPIEDGILSPEFIGDLIE